MKHGGYLYKHTESGKPLPLGRARSRAHHSCSFPSWLLPPTGSVLCTWLE